MRDFEAPLTLLAFGDSADRWKSEILERCSDVEVISMAKWGNDVSNIDRVNGLIGWRFPDILLKSLPNLKWVQLISVGADALVKNPWIGSEVVITNTRGLYADSIADYALWALLTLFRNFHVVLRNQTKHRWKHVLGPGLRNKVVGILGLGQIGQAIALRAKGFGLKVVGIAREISSTQSNVAIDDLYSVKDLTKAISQVDALILCVPLTPDTRDIINEETFEHMKSGIMVINLSRAEIMKESLLIQALKKGKVGGAALDVFEKEPLTRWNRLWSVENLIATPHICGLTNDYFERVENLIAENVHRFSSQQPLLNIVDRNKGY